MPQNDVANTKNEQKAKSSSRKKNTIKVSLRSPYWERREIAAADRRIQAIDRMAEQLMIKRRKKEKLERITLYCMLGFSIFVVILIWATDGRIIDRTVAALQSVEDSIRETRRNLSIDCQLAKNKNIPYCLEKVAQTKSEWQEMTMTNNEGRTQFGLNKRKNKTR